MCRKAHRLSFYIDKSRPTYKAAFTVLPLNLHCGAVLRDSAVSICDVCKMEVPNEEEITLEIWDDYYNDVWSDDIGKKEEKSKSNVPIKVAMLLFAVGLVIETCVVNVMYKKSVVPTSKHKTYNEVLKENYDAFSINVALYGSKNDYILYTDAKTIEVNEGVLLNQDRLYIDFKEAIVIDENKFTYSFFDYVNEIK